MSLVSAEFTERSLSDVVETEIPQGTGRNAANPTYPRGDIQGVLAHFGNYCEVEFSGPKEIPFAGKYTGARGMGEALQKFTSTCEIIEFVPDEFHADGDFVTVLGHEHCRCKATGREWRTRLVETFIVREGKIRSFLCMYDTARVVAAYSQGATRT